MKSSVTAIGVSEPNRAHFSASLAGDVVHLVKCSLNQEGPKGRHEDAVGYLPDPLAVWCREEANVYTVPYVLWSRV